MAKKKRVEDELPQDEELLQDDEDELEESDEEPEEEEEFQDDEDELEESEEDEELLEESDDELDEEEEPEQSADDEDELEEFEEDEDEELLQDDEEEDLEESADEELEEEEEPAAEDDGEEEEQEEQPRSKATATIDRRFIQNKLSKIQVRTLTRRADEPEETPARKRLEGYAAVFYQEGEAGTEYDLFGDGSVLERIAPEAFDEAIGRDDVRALFNHSQDHLLGRTSSGTLTLEVDEVGLKYSIDLPDTSLGRDLEVLIGRGDITGSSFGFYIDGDEVQRNGSGVIRTITRATLRDVAPVSFPAYEATNVELSERSKASRRRSLTPRLNMAKRKEERRKA